MFRSFHMKLVMILILLIVSVMAVMGTFLINSVGNFYLADFNEQMGSVFTPEMLQTLERAAEKENGGEQLSNIVQAYKSSLGVDNHRDYFVLNRDGSYISGSVQLNGNELTRTPNLIAAMAGKLGDEHAVIENYMDVAIPIGSGDHQYIVYVHDDKQEVQELSWRFFSIVMQAMIFGLLAAVLLSFLLSKTITTPIENIKEQAQLVAAGDFSHRLDVESGDEIGNLTQTFNYMAEVLQNTIEEVEGERDKLSTLFLHLTDGVAAFAPDGHMIHMNPATERLMGVKFRENMTFSEVFPNSVLPNVRRTDEQSCVQSEISSLGRTLNVLMAPYGATESERGILVVIHDITEQRKLENARREFVANVSHELRTPLTNIKSYTETLIDAAGEIDPETEVHFLGVISNEADRMTRIVKDLLTLSKLDYGRMDLRFAHFSMQDLLESIYEAMRLDAEKNGHALTLDIQGKMPEINGDRERLEQVGINIISNAVKYTPAGGHIELHAEMRDDRHVLISVTDDGLGIPENDVPRLFERFYRVDKARSREKGGTGLGLAIAKEMVEAHHGTIHLESTLDVGTTVTIILPVDLPMENEGHL